MPKKYNKILIVFNSRAVKHPLDSIEVHRPPVLLYGTGDRPVETLETNSSPKKSRLVHMVEEKINFFTNRITVEGDSSDFVREGELGL
jgi:hypothetical protein